MNSEMSDLTVDDITQKFDAIANPIHEDFANKLEELYNSELATLKEKLAAQLQGGLSGFLNDTLADLLKEFTDRFTRTADELVARFEAEALAAVNDAENEAPDDETIDATISQSIDNAVVEVDIDGKVSIFRERIETIAEETVDGLTVTTNTTNISGQGSVTTAAKEVKSLADDAKSKLSKGVQKMAGQFPVLGSRKR